MSAEFWTIIAAIAGVLSAATVIWHRGIKPWFRATMDSAKRSEWVDTQMRPNHGTSLVDKVDESLSLAKTSHEKVCALESRSEGFERRLGGVEDAIGGMVAYIRGEVAAQQGEGKPQ